MTDDTDDEQQLIITELTVRQWLDSDGNKRLTLYIPNDGEVDTTTAVGLLEQAKFQIIANTVFADEED